MLRRPAVLLAIALDVAVAIGALVLLANGGSFVILALAAILAIAPWAAIIDDAEKPRRKD
jgi:membrane protein implicated in regulation of membrane protease activity